MLSTPETNHICAILECEDELRIYSNQRYTPVACESIDTLIQDLSVGDTEVDILATAEGVVFDIRLNKLSLGYFATWNYCKAYNIKHARLLYHGEYNEDQLRDFADSGNIAFVPLFLGVI